MIQRIQTLYLVAGALLLALFVALGDAWASQIATEQAWLGTLGYGLAVVTAAAALVSVALYKNRELQRRVIYGAQWLDLAVVVVVLVGLYLSTDSDAPTAPVGLYLVALQPVAAYVLLRMARQRVTADIEMVRSMDRIR
jgi:O-antigen ligase